MATYHPSQKLFKLDELEMRYTAGEVTKSSSMMSSCGPFYMDEKRQDDQLEPTFNSSVMIQYVA